jgi:cytochrome c553
MANYRNKKLLELCRELPCQLCGRIDGTVCAAHSNQQRDGKGTAIKASDAMIASLCSSCHHDLDNGNKLSKQERVELWELAHRLTFKHFVEHEMLVVK